MSIDIKGPPENFLIGRKRKQTLTIACLPFSRDGSSYYRLWLPFKHLKEQSLHQYINILDDPLDPSITPDVTILQRPAGTGGLQMIERIAGQTKVVYEVDDDMLNVESAGLPHLTDDRTKEAIRRCLRLCDMVTVSSPHLAEMVAPYNDTVVVLPNFVKQGLLDIQRPRRDKLTIGFAGGTTHRWDVEEFRMPMRRILSDNPEVDVHFVGDDHSPPLGKHCRWTAWNQDVGHYYKNIDFDIALAPSADHLFNRSKTPIRALEMAALGIPIVASDRLPYSDFVKDHETGLLVRSETQWRDAIQYLIDNPEVREQMGEAARKQASELTIEGNWQLWESAYEKAASL